jgi:RNA polymerase sigma factor for flagellar operon FliA
VDAAGWIVGTSGVAVGLAFGLDQMRRSLTLSRQLDRLEARMMERAPQGSEAVARQLEVLPPLTSLPTGREVQQAIADAIIGLPEREKLVVTLHYYEGLTKKEIAEILAVADTTVHELLHRALLRLRSRLGEGFRFD